MKNYYNEIAQHIASIIPIKWKRVYFLGEVELGKKSYSSTFYFEDLKGDFIKCFAIPKKYGVSQEIFDQLMKELRVLFLLSYDSFCEENEVPWEQMKISFALNEKITVDYKYDVYGISGRSQVHRELLWAYETFKYMPEDDFFRSVLEEMISK